MLTAVATAAHADPVNQPDAPKQIAQTPAAAALKLPQVVVHPDSWYYDPYVGGRGQKASSMDHIKSEHFVVPTGYDADVTMHPYTSLLGPCPEGANPSQGCRHPTGTPITPSHYERPPFNQ